MLFVFDLDGTLVDSRRDLADSANELIREYGGRAQPEDAVGRMVGDGAATLVRRALAAAGVDPAPPGALARFLEIYDARLLLHTQPYDGMRDALDAVRGLGPAAVLTNKPLAATRRLLDALALAPYFADVVGGDGPFARKPDPEGLCHLMRAHGVAPRHTILVGDSRIDWQTAANAGVAVCLARYGFGFEGFPADRLTGGELAVDAPSQIPEVLTRFARG